MCLACQSCTNDSHDEMIGAIDDNTADADVDGDDTAFANPVVQLRACCDDGGGGGDDAGKLL